MTNNPEVEALTHVEALIEKAAKAEKSEDAMRFSQAACNAANAVAQAVYVKQQAKAVSTPTRREE